MRGPPSLSRRDSLGFTLAAIYIGIAITIATVYMGLTVIPIFALVTGWSEGYLLSDSRLEAARGPVRGKQPEPLFAFQRVVA